MAEKSARRAVEILKRHAEAADASDACRADLALCYSNLAAIQSKAGRTDDAIASYDKAVSLRESLVRKSPSIVRHRSELAASLNNLALLKIDRGDLPAAAAAFGNANRLFAELLDDHPHQMAYASGWAALLNNQALALAKIERYDESIEAYRQAISVQQRVVEQLGHSSELRRTLSRMKYNFSQALQEVGRFDEAAEVALTRRQLWQGHGERLFGVAVELAQILRGRGGPIEPTLRSAAVATLRESREAGYQPHGDLAADPRFENLRDEPGFSEVINHQEKL